MTISTASFNERLDRIERERQRHKGRIVLHVGADEVMVKTLEDMSVKMQGAKRTKTSGLVLMIAGVFGVLAFAASVALRARFLPLPAPEHVLGDVPMAIGIGLGLIVASVLGPLLGLRGTPAWIAQAAGVIFAAATLHNLAFWVPEEASLAFTADWVQLQQTATAPDSIVFREKIFAL